MSAHQSPPLSPLSVEEWFNQRVSHALTSSESLGWKYLTLNISELQSSRGYTEGPLVEQHYLVHILQGKPHLQAWMDGVYYDAVHAPGTTIFYPGGYQSYGRWNADLTAAFIQLSPQLLFQLAEDNFKGDPAQVQFSPAVHFHDPLLAALISEMCDELKNPGPFSALFADSAARVIMLQLLRKHSSAALMSSTTRAAFTPRQRRVIEDYIENHLEEKIALSELASLLFMSLSHFERTFRADFNCPPYRYILMRRIAQAKRLLTSSPLSLYEIARQTGFANQSHFTRHFTRSVGISPARFRDQLRE